VLNSPEVQFIQEKNNDSRIILTKVLDDFGELIKMSNYQAECKNPTMDEK